MSFVLHPADIRRGEVAALVADLRAGRDVADFRFDLLVPPGLRRLSVTHWTPVQVALRAAELLAPCAKTKVLDIGSGCGKFCLIAALSSGGRFTGVEQRPHLAATAKRVAGELGAARASFVSGDMADLDWTLFDAFYLFNPFYENLMRSIRIDETVPSTGENFARCVSTVQAKLGGARVGTRVAMYHGFGGDMPPGYEQVTREALGTAFLELWVKTQDHQG
ncbi:MAG: class I SAM-dependent methyltransferase [Elusimicrobia bacterium]|nr:class I SAM-dependent methyltransferase [Elusimicrobiota bacterium]